MFVNVSYDNPYNQDLAKKFISYQLVSNNAYEPDKIQKPPLIGGNMYSRAIGGSRPYVNQGSYERKNREDVLPGTSANYPQYNSTELMMVDKLGSNNQLPYIENVDYSGGNVFKKIGRTLKKAAKSKGAKVLGNILTKTASRGLDFAAPALGSFAAPFVGMDPAIGRELATVARRELKNQTGFGKMTKKQLHEWNKSDSGVKSGGSGLRSGGIATYEGSCVKSGGMSGVRSGGGVKSGGATDKRKRRGEMIKKIMKEKKMNLAQASKYIKENNLL